MEKTKYITILAIITALCLAGDSMLYIALPIYWQEAGLSSLWEVGILLSINRFVRLPLNPLAGWLYSKINLHKGLLIAVTLGTIANLGYSLGKGFWLWIVLRSAWGAAWALLSLGGLLTVIQAAEENNRGYLIGKYNGLYRLGSLAGMLFGGLLASSVGFKQTAFFYGILSLISIPLLFVLIIYNPLRQTTNTHNNRQEAKFINCRLLTAPVLRILCTGLIISMVFRGLINSTLSLVIENNFRESICLGGLIIYSASASGIIQSARWAWEPFLAAYFGRWSDGVKGRLPLFMGTLFIASLGLIAIPFNMPFIPWLIITLLLMVCATSLTTLTDCLSSDIAKSSLSTIGIMTLYSIFNDLGAAIGPFISYLFIEKLKYGIYLSYQGCAALLILIIFLWYKPLKKFFHPIPTDS